MERVRSWFGLLLALGKRDHRGPLERAEVTIVADASMLIDGIKSIDRFDLCLAPKIPFIPRLALLLLLLPHFQPPLSILFFRYVRLRSKPFTFFSIGSLDKLVLVIGSFTIVTKRRTKLECSLALGDPREFYVSADLRHSHHSYTHA